ncbi:dynein heavy chain domain-containing protein 1 isoform X2 [Phyllopteryx taeniolatus]|uniref:dynein heavy chain domain-containing protein 1 isoform X2 n=1 Tax=Phyllopteryx taeniolatus TaxID=161469 RepID=UPI002AD51745|nr:dynein heavy chain domain-containing protein 1 isoform X2 [Phyllopteryx taeniolatus]
MEPLMRSADCGNMSSKPKKKDPSEVGNSQATLPSLWPVPYSPSASSLRRNLFDPSAIVAVTVSSVTPSPVAQAGSVKILTESKWTERLLSGASVLCTDTSGEASKSLTDKDESRVTIRDLFSLPAIVPSVPPESPRSVVQLQSPEPKWTEKTPMKASASFTDIPVKTADEAAQSFTEKESSKVTRRDLFNLPAIGPIVSPRTPHLAGSRKATAEIKWTEKPRQKAVVSCTDIPATKNDEAAAESFTETDESITTCRMKRPNLVEKVPVTGMEIVQLFLKNRDVGELKVFYLKEQESDLYRPYDLRVVPDSEAGSEHYVFTANTVLHVTRRGYGGLVTLEEWYRETVLWTALQAIPFFREFILRNAVTLWYRNVRATVYKRRFEEVQALLLTNIPQYRNGLLLLSRLIEDLKVTHLLPLDETKTYTLLEFQNVLVTSRQKVLNSLSQLSQFRICILSKAKEESYKVLKELQEHLDYADMPQHCCKPIHLHQAHLNNLQRDFAHGKSVLQKLGNFAALVNQIIMQTLVTVVQKNVTLVLSNILKRKNSHSSCLFQTDLCLGADQLTLEPPLHLLRETLTQALLTAGDSISQMCETSGLFLEVSSALDRQDETSDVSCSSVVADSDGEIKDNDGMPGLTHYSCCQWIREQRPGWKLMMTVQGHRMPGSYYPLSKEQLVWYITINDVSISINKEQSELMQASILFRKNTGSISNMNTKCITFFLSLLFGQAAESEIQQLLESYVWLLDIRVFISQWSPASLESMKGQPALLYQELIKKLRRWIEQIHATPSFISTSNQLFIVHCTHMKEYLGQQLSLIENEVQEELMKQMKALSESFLHDLEEAHSALRTEPKDLHDLPKYVDVVWKSVNMLADMQKRLEYVHTLQDSICTYYREMTIQELSLEKKMLDMWACYYSHLKQADSTLRYRLPTVATALHTMSPLMASDLRNIVSNATSGPFLDPRQNAEQLASKLNYMHLRVDTATSNLEHLSRTGEIFRENPVDLTDLTDIPKLTARRELWELLAFYRQCLHEWNKFLLIELAFSQAQEQIAHWQLQVANLSSIIPADDAVLQETSETINDLSYRLKILARFRSPTIKPKHRSLFFKGIGLRHASDTNATLAQLISQPFDLHQEFINKICSDAQKENLMEQTFKKIQQAWTNHIFQLHTYTGPCCHRAEPHVLTNDSTSDASSDAKIIIGLEFLFSEIENDLMTMTNMHRSRHSVDFRLQVEEWMHLLQELDKLLHLFEIYQQKWIFLNNMFQETILSVQRWDLLPQFQSVDESFKTMMHYNSTHASVLDLVRPKTGNDNFPGANLCQTLLNNLSTLNTIANQMSNRLHSFCKSFPRLYFLSDREIVELLSLQPTPTSLLPFVRKFFKGVQLLEVEDISVTEDLQNSCDTHNRVLGVFGNLQEHITFLSPLEPNHNPLIWLSRFQEQLKSTMIHLMTQCADERKQLEPSNQDSAHYDTHGQVLTVLDMTSKYPLQCLLVAEETIWCSVLHQAFQDASTVRMSRINALNSAQLENLCQSLRDAFVRSKGDAQLSKYTMTCLRTFVLLRMKQAEQLTKLMQVQCQPALSFEWLSSLKYCIASEGQSLKEIDGRKCYVDILGHRLPYGYEYFGPEDWGMVHSPCTDRTIMGILLAVTSFRCGFVNGPCSSGKTNTVVCLGKALGRHVVMLHCCPNMSSDIFQKMLLGALLTGAWFVLDSVDLLPRGVQTSLAQHLEDIYQSFSGLSRKKEDQEKTASGCKSMFDPEYFMVFSGVTISASPSYGCVLISSKGCTAEISQSLRFSTRPVALTHPDYMIIVEIMLTSFGFKEAKCFSQRLVSLISLSKDSLCLPVFTAQNQSSYLDILQKITSASKKLLKQSVRHEKFIGKARQSFVIQAILKSPENENAEDINEDQEQAIFPGLLEEIAVVKATHSVLSQMIYVPQKVSLFNSIFKDMFPIACQLPFIQQYTQDEPNFELQEAVSEELDQLLLHSNTEINCQALTLYQTLSFSHAVILLGPTGSGKTTCYNALAGALSRLANKTGENISDEKMFEVHTPQAKLQTSASNWSSVNTVVIFPNAMSHEELFGGFCDEIGWQDGAVTKALRDSERHKTGKLEMCKTKKPCHETNAVKWLVMDGEPLRKPGWLDHLSTLSDLEDPFLSIPSGEMLMPHQSHFKLLVETTDLSEASPSAVTRCSLIYFNGTDVWNSVWKSEMDSLHRGFTLDKGTLEMWTQLSEDLFSSTLSLLKKNGISNKGQPSTYGLTEIMSFIRILRALLQHFARTVKYNDATGQKDKRDMPPGRDSNIREDIFLLAYVWGFGGHLHPRLWPQFDIVARQVLFDSRSKIVVPHEGTVFEFFFNIDNKIYSKNTLLTKSITPKHWKYTCLLTVMLEAIQPVLLAGEPGSGKSTVCNTLLCFDKPHIKIPASSIRGPTDLRHLLCGISYQKSCQKNKGVMAKQPGLMLYVDDLHETPCDVTGKTSKILETLRQSISKGGVLAFDSNHFKVLSPGIVTYLATCCVFELDNPHVGVISSRLSRLFSIFALPSLTTELIFSIHSPQLKLWLRDVPFIPNVVDMVHCIINATENLYEDVCNNFQPTKQRPRFLFSHHDLKKVFQGMCLWQPVLPKTETRDPKLKSKCSQLPQEPLAMELNIVHLWIHECMRTFVDRISSEDEITKLQSLIAKAATVHFTLQLRDESNLEALFAPSFNSLIAQLGPPDTCPSRSQVQEPESAASTEQSNVPRLHVQETFLQHLLEIMTKLTYGPQFVGNHSPILKCSSYQPQDLSLLIQHLFAHIDMKDNEKQDIDGHFAFKYTLHRQRMCQMLHIFRALLIPGGHGLLMASGSGTGRKTTVRLAAHVSGSHLIEVHSGNECELHKILKEAGNQTRVYEANTIILVHDNISASVREELLVALRSYPGLYTDQELAKLVSRVTAVYKTKRFLLDSWIFDKYLCQNLRDVHVFMLMPAVVSSSSGNYDCKEQITKALGLCCVEMYQPWFNQSLTEVAAHYLKNIFQNLTMQGSQVGLAVAMAGIHQSAYQYASVLLMAQPFSPYTYMAFISHFSYLCKVMLKELECRSNRLNTCLSQLDALDSAAMKYKHDLIRMQGIVAEIQQRVDELLGAIDDQKSLLQKAEKKCAKQKRKIQILVDRIAESEDELRPFFQAALDVLHSLDPLDLEEVRHYRDPPDGVVLVMDAVLLLFDRPPGWDNAKRLFGQCNMYKCLEVFDFYSLTDIQMLQLGELIQNPMFVPECVREVSKACETLCRWVLAVNNCGSRRYQLMVRKQLDLMLIRAQDQLEQIEDYMEEINRCLAELDVQLLPVQKLLDEQLQLLHKAECLERNAANAVALLLKHTRVWRAEAQVAQLQTKCLPGDAMVLAAIISYFGPFPAEIRTELLSKWRVLCQTGNIDTNPKDHRSSMFTSTDTAPPQPTSDFLVPLSETLQPLLSRVLGVTQWPSHETALTRLVLKLLLWGCRRSWVKYWPLLADTQHHLEIDSKNWVITGEIGDDVSLGKEFECDIVVCADDPKLICQLDLAAEKGLKVLVTHIERVTVSPKFLAALARPAASCPPGSKQTAHQTHPDFCLLLSTHYPIRLLSTDIHPSILAQVDVVDLSPSSDQIQELMLTQLLQSECKVLLIQHLQMQNDKQLLQRKLITEEDSVMDSILQSDTTRMQAPEFLTQVAEVQESMTFAQTELQLVNERQEYHEPLLAAPQQLIYLAWLFYQALQEVSRLSPAYYFSLSGFIAVMQEAFAEKVSRLVSYATGKVIGGVIPAIRNKMVAKLMFYYRPCLFRSHSMVFKLLVTLAEMQTNQICSPPERTSFLVGLKDIFAPRDPHSSKDNWTYPQVDFDLLCLEKIPAFKGLTDSLTSSHKEWQEFLDVPSSVVAGPVPCGSHSHLSLMQRALLSKTLRPHSTGELAEAMAACQFRLPRHTSVPHCGNPGGLYTFLVAHEGPIILTWPCPSKDKWTSIQPLHLVKLLASKATDIKEVKVISVGGLCDSNFIIFTLEKALRDGHWLVFNNCHLLEHWNAKLVACFNQLFSPFGATDMKSPHPDFRLWFLTEESAQSFLPASVRMCGLPLVCDSSWNVKEELSCSLQYLSSVAQRQSGSVADNTELLLRCAAFHSVLLQREAYKYLGQARIYSWSQSDLLALVNALFSSASLCQDKTKALQYIAVNLVHGGHVLESADSEVVRNTAETCFSKAPPLASGPHILANVISSTEHCDFAKLLRMLDRQLLHSVDVSEPLLLGFSADVEAEIVKINSHNLNHMLQASQTPPGLAAACSSMLATLPEFSQASEKLHALQDYLTHQNETRLRNAGAVFQSPLYDFLLAEWHELSVSVSLLLSRLRQPLRYVTATFLSLPTLTTLSRLQRRAELLSSYLWRDNTSAPRAAYRLSAFSNAKGFLVALMRKAAQAHHKYISDINLRLEVRDDPLFTPLPKDIVYLCDLELRGASWDVQRAALENTLSPQPCSMPLICIRAQVKDTHVPRSHNFDQVYHCPIYLEDLDTGAEGRDGFNVVTTVPLPTALEPSLCSLRKVRLVSRLFDP